MTELYRDTTGPDPRGIGDNQPPATLDPDAIISRLLFEYTNLLERKDYLIDQAGDAPEIVSNDDDAGKVSDLCKAIAAWAKTANSHRTSEKEPFDTAAKAVHGFFKTRMDELEGIRKNLLGRISVFERKKAEAARRAAQEAERKAREEAQKREAEAKTDADIDAAIEAEKVADDAAKVAASKPADLARTRGDLGSVATLRTVWKGEVTNARELDLEALRPFFTVADLQKALNVYVRAKSRDGATPPGIKGARIFQQSDAVVR